MAHSASFSLSSGCQPWTHCKRITNLVIGDIMKEVALLVQTILSDVYFGKEKVGTNLSVHALRL